MSETTDRGKMDARRLVTDPASLIAELRARQFYGLLELKFVNGQILYAQQTEAIRFSKPEIQPTRELRDRSYSGQNPKTIG